MSYVYELYAVMGERSSATALYKNEDDSITVYDSDDSVSNT